MTEDAARKKLIAIGRQIIAQWDTGRDWRWPTAGREGIEALQSVPLDPSWPDYRTLSAAWWFYKAVSDSIQEGMSNCGSLSWEEALAVIEDTARRLERRQQVEDPVVLRYTPVDAATGCSPLARLMARFRRS
ncbi:MAG: hypothetical protein ACLQVD_13280 [Capsulimonadaceae bacterium]